MSVSGIFKLRNSWVEGLEVKVSSTGCSVNQVSEFMEVR